MKTVYTDGGLKESMIPDDNYCCVSAFSNAFRVSYRESYALATECGRKHRRGFYMNLFLNHAFKRGYKFTRIGLGKKGLTIRRFIENYTIGRFICVRRGHAFCVIHGEIHDHLLNSERQIIYSAYRIDI